MHRLLLYSLVLLVLLLALPLNWLWGERQHMPALPVIPVVGHGQLMANLDLEGLTAEMAEARLSQIASDGMTYVRLRLPWHEIQPEKDVWQWQKVDGAIRSARKQGLEIVLLLDGAPTWAVSPEDVNNPLAPPHDIRDFGRFAAAVAERYAKDIQVYQIWDEPNIAPHWGSRWVDPRGYFQLLRESANSIRSVDPAARIMLAALAPTTADDGANLSDLKYLERLYDLGAAEFFDIAAGAAYGFDQPSHAEPAPDQLNFRRPELIHAIMQSYGDADTPVWITAWGWWTPIEDQSIQTSPWRGIDHSQLPTYQQQGYQLAHGQWPWSGPMAWVTYSLNPDDDPRRLGFVQRLPSGEQTLAGETLSQLPDNTTMLGTGNHRMDEPAIMATSWRLGAEAADPNESAAEIAVPFTGSSIALEIQRGWYWATLYAEIDGEPAPLLPQDVEGRAYIALHDPDNGVEIIPLATDLSAEAHELRLVASGGWGQWPLRRIIVDHQSWPQPWPTIPLTALLVIALFVVAYGWLRTLNTPAGQSAMKSLNQTWENLSLTVFERMGKWLLLLVLALILAIYAVQSTVLSLVLLALLAFFLALRLDLVPALVLVVLPFYLRPKSIGPVGIAWHELLIWMASGLWLLRRIVNWLAGRTRHLTPPTQIDESKSLTGVKGAFSLSGLDYPVLLLLVVGLFATVNAERFAVAFYDYRTIFLTPFLYYWLLTRTHANRSLDLSLLSDALVLGAVLISFIGLRQFISGDAYFVEGVPRIYALFGSANNLALYLGRILPLLIAVVVLGRSPRRWFYLVALIAVGMAAFLTFSKGVLFISIPVALLLLALIEPRMRWVALILLILGALALIPFMGATRFTGLVNTSEGTTFLRLQLWQSAWQMFLDHPWLGVGPDNFLYAYRSVYVLPTAWEELQLSHPHNLFLDLLTRVGLMGFVAGMWLLLATQLKGFFLLVAKRIPHSSVARSPSWQERLVPYSLRNLDSSQRPYFLGLFVGLVAGLFHGLIDNSIFLVDLAILTYLVIGVTQYLWLSQTAGPVPMFESSQDEG